MEYLQAAGVVLTILSPLASAAYVVGKVRAELAGLRRDIDRHDVEIRALRQTGARG